MITDSEIIKFAQQLDNEYEREIKPMLIDANNHLRKVFGVVMNTEMDEICHKCAKNVFTCFDVNNSIWGIITNLRYTAENRRPHELSIPSRCGFYAGYDSHFTIVDLVKCIKSYAQRIYIIKHTKERFNSIRNAYNSLFVNDGSKNFKHLISDVLEWKENMLAVNSKDDDEIYTLFGKSNPQKKIRITVVVEEV